MGRRAGWVAGGVLTVALLAGGGYVAADAYDVAPGPLTLAPEPAPPAPFPTAPGAVEAPAPTTVLTGLDPTAPVPDPAQVAALAQTLADDARMGASTGVSVVDVLTGQVLADVAAATPQVPASTAKVLTGLAALSALGGDRTLATTVLQPEPGRLVLVGGGDVMLAAGAGDPAAT
ncbi:MAG TPA: D-alanyl-D-alanine carboxypeptidase, partial [Actinotalea sp.]|nr:D-alanyl-D-alanine carboxypeptidase [Actinotalea sp.]